MKGQPEQTLATFFLFDDGNPLCINDFLCFVVGAYVVLLRASERGFDPEAVGVSMNEAADVAAEFSLADRNADGRIDSLEFRYLCEHLSPGLTAEQCEAAMSVVDTNGDGYLDFSEFLNWWVTRTAAAAAGGGGERGDGGVTVG